MSDAIDDHHAQAGAAVAQKLDTHESAGAAREPGAVERRDAVVMPEGARPAHELVAGAGPADHLERVVVARRRSEEHTSELQSHSDLVCRLLLEKKNQDRRSGTPQLTTCVGSLGRA